MGKNLVIFSDGTGQAGGFRFDEVRGSMRRRHRRWPLTQSNTSKDSLVRGGILHLTCSTFAKSLRVGCGKTMARLTQEIVPKGKRVSLFHRSIRHSGRSWKSTLFTFAFLAFAAGLGMLGWLLTHFDQTPVFGPLFAYLTFRNVFWGIIAAGTLISATVYLFTHFKWVFWPPP
jgi:hypothetical protein